MYYYLTGESRSSLAAGKFHFVYPWWTITSAQLFGTSTPIGPFGGLPQGNLADYGVPATGYVQGGAGPFPQNLRPTTTGPIAWAGDAMHSRLVACQAAVRPAIWASAATVPDRPGDYLYGYYPSQAPGLSVFMPAQVGVMLDLQCGQNQADGSSSAQPSLFDTQSATVQTMVTATRTLTNSTGYSYTLTCGLWDIQIDWSFGCKNVVYQSSDYQLMGQTSAGLMPLAINVTIGGHALNIGPWMQNPGRLMTDAIIPYGIGMPTPAIFSNLVLEVEPVGAPGPFLLKDVGADTWETVCDPTESLLCEATGSLQVDGCAVGTPMGARYVQAGQLTTGYQSDSQLDEITAINTPVTQVMEAGPGSVSSYNRYGDVPGIPVYLSAGGSMSPNGVCWQSPVIENLCTLADAMMDGAKVSCGAMQASVDVFNLNTQSGPGSSCAGASSGLFPVSNLPWMFFAPESCTYYGSDKQAVDLTFSLVRNRLI